MLWLDPVDRARRAALPRGAPGDAARTPAADREPGKILHEVRECELAHLGEVPFGRYYGSVDSTPLFVALAGLYWQRTRDRADAGGALAPRARRRSTGSTATAIATATASSTTAGGCRAGCATRAGRTPRTRCSTPTARSPAAPIALCEVQGYVLPRAPRGGAARVRPGREATSSADLEEKAERAARALRGHVLVRGARHLRARARRRQAALPRAQLERRPAPVHRHVPPRARGARRAGPVRRATSSAAGASAPSAAREKRFNPTSYHNGSVWPHDNALIALGLARYGHSAEARRADDRAVRRRRAHAPAAPARALLRLRPHAAARRRRSTRWPARRRRGPRARRSRWCRPASASRSTPPANACACASRACPQFLDWLKVTRPARGRKPARPRVAAPRFERRGEPARARGRRRSRSATLTARRRRSP